MQQQQTPTTQELTAEHSQHSTVASLVLLAISLVTLAVGLFAFEGNQAIIAALLSVGTALIAGSNPKASKVCSACILTKLSKRSSSSADNNQ